MQRPSRSHSNGEQHSAASAGGITERSFGVVPICGEDVLLLLHRGGGHWSFPKGHADPGETSIETALRELHEETGVELSAEALQSQEYRQQYRNPRNGRLKEVVYFVGSIPSQARDRIVIQRSEISDYRWVALADAHTILTHDEDKTMLEDIRSAL